MRMKRMNGIANTKRSKVVTATGVEMATAYHEAGHALTAYLNGQRIRSITIMPSDDSNGACIPYSSSHIANDHPNYARDVRVRVLVEKDAMTCIAGRAAEMMFCADTGHPYSDGHISDYESAGKLLAGVDAEDPDLVQKHLVYLEGRVRLLLEKYRFDLHTLAELLIRRKRMSGRAVRKFLVSVLGLSPGGG
jgi:hypothetical protein